jgi:hypothetical protein
MNTIDITITAALRPSIVNATARSIYEHVIAPFDDSFQYRVIVNIDPVGEPGVTQDDIEKIYKTMFGEVTVYKPETPSFPEAIRRVWKAVDADVTFYAQDSKQILQQVPVDAIIHAFTSKPDLASVSIGEMKKTSRSPEPVRWDETHQMYIVPYFHKAVTCRPSFLRREYVHWISDHFRNGISAEKTMKARDERLDESERDLIRSFSSKYRYAFLQLEEDADARYVDNIGRKWRLEHGFTKPQGGGIAASWTQQQKRLLNRKYFRLWKEVRGRQIRRLWGRITGRG